tara:strand:+ start:2587 stop:3228 length:642 start_codon:yes stop_codon:yes gene_type:complete
MLKKIIKNLTPPLIYKFLSFIFNQNKYQNDRLFDGEDELFKSLITNTDVYGEYGCGNSTIWVSKNYNINIYSVETDLFWQKKISKTIKNKKCEIYHADLGKVRNWGMPLNYERENFFNSYTDWIWQQKYKPTVVLIDGRFRVCCFLTTLINSNSGTKIIFDDYNDRDHYHYVEKYIKPTKKNNRQSLFIVPGKDQLDIDKIKKSINNFRYVFD